MTLGCGTKYKEWFNNTLENTIDTFSAHGESSARAITRRSGISYGSVGQSQRIHL